jgi:poly(ADP-ribose) glycohydrolase ARH3
MISVAESLLRRRGLDPEDLLRAMAENYDPARGYGKGMKLVFRALERGDDWREAARASWAEGSKGNGAAVRVAPLACLYFRDEERLREAALASAALSHTHPLGRAGCLLQALALARALRTDAWDALAFLSGLEEALSGEELLRGKLAGARDLVQRGAGGAEAVAQLGNGASAEESVPLALFAFARWAPSFEEIVRNTVQCGGDTDSTAALSGALAGALLGVEAIPGQWLANLENGRKGRDYVLSLADGLLEGV